MNFTLLSDNIKTRLVRIVPGRENDAGLGVGDVVLQRLFWVSLAERDRGYRQLAGPDAQEGRGEGGAVGGEHAHAVPTGLPPSLLEDPLQTALHQFADKVRRKEWFKITVETGYKVTSAIKSLIKDPIKPLNRKL